MMTKWNLAGWVSDSAVTDLAAPHLWQITILFVIVMCLGSFSLAKQRPHLMLLLWVLFLAKCLVPPVIQSPISFMGTLTPAALYQFGNSRITAQNQALSNASSTRDVVLQVNSSDTRAPINRSTTQPASEVRSRNWIAWSVAIWLGGSTIVFLGLTANYLRVRNQIFFGQSIDDDSEIQRMLRELESQIGLTPGAVRLVVSTDSIGPLVFGFLRPTIVIPQVLLDRGIALRPILTHELCHVWRRDHLLGFLQIAVQTFLWFHPLVWIAGRRINRLCEICCDDDTMRLFDLNSKSYASGLLDVLSLQRVIRPIHLAPGIRPIEITKQRLRMIASNQRPRPRRSQVLILCVFLFLMLPTTVPGSRVMTTNAAPAIPATQRVAGFDQVLDSGELVGQVELGERGEQRSEMQFFLGRWNVTNSSGQPIGTSTFSYEKSGNMMREDWVSLDGSTAQGITFYDPNERCWKMTWVDSQGTFMEAAGQWEGECLILNGAITSKNGVRRAAESTLTKRDDDRLIAELKIQRGGVFTVVSSSQYVRSTP